MAYYFYTPFGTSGDKTAIPLPAQGDGSISYTQGYGPNYSAPRDTDPAALTIERNKMNQLFFAITSNIQQYQQRGVPEYITSADNGGTPYGYSKYAQVRYDNGSEVANYISLVASNTALPTDTSKWAQIRVDPAYLGVAQTFSAVQTFASAGTPIVINSTNSTALKLTMKDNGTNRGGIGATSAWSHASYLADLTTIAGGWDSSGHLLPGAAATYDLGSASAQYRAVFANRVNVLGNTAPTNGIYLPAANTVGVAANGLLVASFTSTGINNTVIGGTTAAAITGTTITANTGFVGGLTGNVTGNVSGSSGSCTGNAATATALQNARTIGGVSFDGTGNIVPQTIQSVNEATDTTCFPLFINDSGSQSQQPKNNANFTFNSNTAGLGVGSVAVTGTTVPANGLYLPAANTPAIAVNSAIGVAFQAGKIGANTSQLHVIPAVTSDTLALLGASQTFSNKTMDASCAYRGYRSYGTLGASYTLAAGDAGYYIDCQGASATVVTVPPNSSVAFTIGTEIDFFQSGAGQVSFAAGAGVTIQSVGSYLKISARYSGAFLKKVGTDTWQLVGNLAA